jgi:hypothetical protein
MEEGKREQLVDDGVINQDG